MQKILVLGGTRFFGKKLVEQLIRDEEDVTIVTRGQASDPFGDTVKRLKADRTDRAALANVLGSSTYDVVYDNICYTPQEAVDAVELFAGRTGRYILTSTQSVYPSGEYRKSESDYNPYRYPLPEPNPLEVEYGEGKRLVEAVMFQKAPFPVAAVRIPIVLGHDDYTRRLHKHIESVQQGLPLGIPNPEAWMCFILSDEVASFLAWLRHSNLEGPVTACSQGDLSTGQILSLIKEAVGKQANILSETEQKSPFGPAVSRYMDTTKAVQAGYTFQSLTDWMPKLIREIVA
jgi:nucleoside-diphosphate-sugar epimerase